MSTEPKFLTFLEILRLKHAELWESKLNHFQLLSKGDLQLLYSHHLDLTLLKLHENTWVLDRDLQIIGTRSIRGEWQAYSIVSPGGFLCLKITNLNFMKYPHPELVNFEAIVENRSNFLRNTTLEPRFDLFKEGHKSAIGSVGESIMNVVHTITDSFPHHDYTNHPNYKIVRPIEDLLGVGSDAVPVVDIAENDLNNYKTETLMLHEYQEVGEWRDLWAAGNVEYLQGFKDMRIHDTHGIRPEMFQGQGQQAGNLGYQQAPPGKHHHDQQEFLGSEHQRLPSYEVDQSKQHAPTGFERAATNLQEGLKEEPSKKEETEFTTGLLKSDVEPPHQIGPSPKTPYHKNELENPPLEMKPLTEQVSPPQLENWGSNVTNASETTPTFDVDFKGEFRNADNRTNLEKINESEQMKETAAP